MYIMEKSEKDEQIILDQMKTINHYKECLDDATDQLHFYKKIIRKLTQ